MQIKDMSAILGTWVGIASAIIGGFLALQNYRADVTARELAASKMADEHVAAAFRMAERFHKPDFVLMRSKLVEAFDVGAHCRSFAPPAPISVQEVFTVVEYFDRAYACVERGLCDEATTRRLLGPYATWWAPGLEHQINETRIAEAGIPGSERYGAGVQALAAGSVPQHIGACPEVR